MGFDGLVVGEEARCRRQIRQTPGSLPDDVFGSNGNVQRGDEVAVGVDCVVARSAAFGGASITVLVLATRGALWQRLMRHKRKRAAELVEFELIKSFEFFLHVSKAFW